MNTQSKGQFAQKYQQTQQTKISNIVRHPVFAAQVKAVLAAHAQNPAQKPLSQTLRLIQGGKS